MTKRKTRKSAANRVANSPSIYLTAYTSHTPELPEYVSVSHTAVHSDLEQFSLIPPITPTNDTSYYSGANQATPII